MASNLTAAYGAGYEVAFKKFAGMAGTLGHMAVDGLLELPRPVLQALIQAIPGALAGSIAGGEGHRHAVKTAASVDALHAGFKRLGILKTPMSRATNTQNWAQQTAGRGLLATSGALAGGGATIPRPRQVPILAKPQLAAHGIDPSSSAGAEAIKPWLDLSKAHGGTVIVPKGGPSAVLNRLSKANTGEGLDLDGAGRRAFNVAVGHHEGFERGVKPHQEAPAFGHLSPDVLMKEHNMFSQMSGPGSEGARRTMQDLRTTATDGPALETLLHNTYGQRGAINYGEGQKIPSAMRRDLVRKVRSGQAQWPPVSQNEAAAGKTAASPKLGAAYEAGKTAAFTKFAGRLDPAYRALLAAGFGAVPGAVTGALGGGEGHRLEGAGRGALGGALASGLAGAVAQPHILAEHLILGMGPGSLGGYAAGRGARDE